MSIDTADRYLAVEPFRDTLSPGTRIYTDRDGLYEARTVDGHPVRIDGTDDRWRAQVHLPASDYPMKGYETFDTVAERLEDAYDEDLITAATNVLDRLESSDSFTAVDDTIEVRYRQRHAWKTDPGDGYSPRHTEDHMFRMIGAGAGAGGTAGAALGATAGPEAALLAGALGAVGGAVAGMADGIVLYDIFDAPVSLSKGTEKGVDWSRRKREELNEWYANRQNRLEDMDLFDRFNEKRRLEAVKDSTRDPHQAQRYRELRDSGVEEDVAERLERHFDRFDERQGVTATCTADSYEEAARFVTTALGTDAAAVERPSIYADQEVFRTLFGAADEGIREELVEAILEREGPPDQEIVTYLEDRHEGMVKQVGQNRTLEDEGL